MAGRLQSRETCMSILKLKNSEVKWKFVKPSEGCSTSLRKILKSPNYFYHFACKERVKWTEQFHHRVEAEKRRIKQGTVNLQMIFTDFT